MTKACSRIIVIICFIFKNFKLKGSQVVYMIHCTRVISDLALIIYRQIMSKSLFVGFGPKMKVVQMNVFDISSEIIFPRNSFVFTLLFPAKSGV